MIRKFPFRSAAALAVCALAACPALEAASPPVPGATFATEAGSGASKNASHPAGAAAVVDGHAILLKDVTARCLRDERSYVVDRMVQDYVVDRECRRRGIAVSAAEIDGNVAALRKAVAPSTLEQVIALHHSSMAYVRNAFKQKIERARLVQGQVKPEPMVHCRAIVIRFAPPGMPETLSGTKRTQEEALSFANDLVAQAQQGKDFAALADRYSEASPKTLRGDYGILYDGMRDADPWIVRSALTLGKNGVFPAPIKSGSSYVLLQGVSTSDDHPASENALYADALHLHQEQQAQFLAPKVVVDLIKQSHRTYCLDPDRLVEAGKPLPAAAATIDGHIIPMKDVVAQCLAEDGPHVVDILVQNYLVDRECKRRGIAVGPAQIDARVENLRRMIAPHTLAEGLASRHMTMDELRYDFKQDLERASLVQGRVKPAKMVHCRVIAVRYAPPRQAQTAAEAQSIPGVQPAGNAPSAPAVSRTEADARALMADIQAQLKQGKDFGDLAARYSEMRSQGGKGDLGVLYPGMRDMDTALLDAGLALNKGETAPAMVKIVGGYALIQAVSTSGDHPASEDALYSDALDVYKMQEASPLIPQAVISLIKKSKVEYYIHA